MTLLIIFFCQFFFSPFPEVILLLSFFMWCPFLLVLLIARIVQVAYLLNLIRTLFQRKAEKLSLFGLVQSKLIMGGWMYQLYYS